MFKSIALRLLLALPMAAIPSAAQGTTHLNVPAKQMVWMSYSSFNPGWDVIVGGNQTFYSAAPYQVPAGFSFVVTDAELNLLSYPAASLSYYGSSLQVAISAPAPSFNGQGAAITLPFGYIPSYGAWSQVNLTSGTRIPAGYTLAPLFRYGYGINVTTAPSYSLILHGYYVAE